MRSDAAKKQRVFEGDEMFYAVIFDFALVALALATFGLFVWCWLAYREDLGVHPSYRQPAPAVTQDPTGTRARRRSA